MIERAFAKRDEYLRDRFASIGEAESFYTKVAGVTFEHRQEMLAGVREGVELTLVRQPDNPHDPNAIALFCGHLQIGYVSRGIARHLAPRIDMGVRYSARIASLTGGAPDGSGARRSRGANIFVERDPGATLAARAQTREPAGWDGDVDRIRYALIGEHQPHDAQRAVLERIERGDNTLAVLGTGRGKSFCFQFPAATRALAGAGKTLAIYPLRALANDQHDALLRKLDPLGLRIFRANGSIGAEERRELFEALRTGAWDFVLATPEFLSFHRESFSGPSAPRLVVVDEAHHLAESTHRPSYVNLAATIAALGSPQVLALTATARQSAFTTMVEELRIASWVIDPTVRENLSVVDARGTRDKGEYLRTLFAGDAKGIVYCNSRTEVTKVAVGLRQALGNVVMFYHAGMPTTERAETEALFRSGALRVVVATSAFGEGIDLPDVRHVVLYHLNFDFTEFNQQAGRAGRDGLPASVHLLFGEADRRINDYLIDLDAPTLATLRSIYRGLRSLARDGTLRGGNADLAEKLDLERVRDRTIAAALRMFAESGLIEVGEDDDGRFVRLREVPERIDLAQNERFAEGEATREAFARFCALALTASPEDLERIVNRPIYPSGVPLRR